VAVLHDVVEDCGVSNQKLAELFDAEVCNGVWWLTKASMSPLLKDSPRAERREADLKKIKQAPQVFQIIKLADRLDNVRGMRFGPRDFVLKTYFPETVGLLNAIGQAAPELANQILQEMVSIETSLLKDPPGGS
jgi:(p)ppGpp synthase/HD superfamily hydrolase